jgi:hypothetical protein
MTHDSISGILMFLAQVPINLKTICGWTRTMGNMMKQVQKILGQKEYPQKTTEQ